jgi:endo-1,4-beta-mannosidase
MSLLSTETSTPEVFPASTFMDPGTLTLGVNYWASHAGTRMWTDWREDVIAEDFRQLAGSGIRVLRVFPLWPDFQPLEALRSLLGEVREYRLRDLPLPNTPAGRAGLDETMLARFERFCELADEQGLKLLVGLVTGWMSGRLFAPAAFGQSNPLTDPTAIKWQSRFVNYFVGRFRTQSAILAWDLGNECNCMGRTTPDQAWVWTHAISTTIRYADPTRMIISGMHSLTSEEVTGLTSAGAAAGYQHSWSMAVQAELTDVLTTHPYPPFTEHCDQDPIDTLRTNLHATAETRMYADIGGKPCFAEEVGNLGTWFGSDERASNFLRANLYSLWANDCRGLFWWNNHDFSHLSHPPYDWNMVEQELGLFDANRRPRRLVHEMKAFSEFLRWEISEPLPLRKAEAVCVLSLDQDSWGAALSAFVLAKQAGFDLEFQTSEQPLRQADLYILPCLSGMKPISVRFFNDLVSAVNAGATLYTSLADAALSRLSDLTGVQVESRERTNGPTSYSCRFGTHEFNLSSNGAVRLNVHPLDAEVLARDSKGRPVITRAQLGLGTSYLLTRPLEFDMVRTPGAHLEGPLADAWRVYAEVAKSATKKSRIVEKAAPFIAATEHPFSDEVRWIVLINHGRNDHSEPLRLRSGWRVSKVIRGSVTGEHDALTVHLPHHEAAVFQVNKFQDSMQSS